MEINLKVLLCVTLNGENSNLVNRFAKSKFNNSNKKSLGIDIVESTGYSYNEINSIGIKVDDIFLTLAKQTVENFA